MAKKKFSDLKNHKQLQSDHKELKSDYEDVMTDKQRLDNKMYYLETRAEDLAEDIDAISDILKILKRLSTRCDDYKIRSLCEAAQEMAVSAYDKASVLMDDEENDEEEDDTKVWDDCSGDGIDESGV